MTYGEKERKLRRIEEYTSQLLKEEEDYSLSQLKTMLNELDKLYARLSVGFDK